jgi:hypothetical protein
VERRRHSNGGELARRSVAARVAPAALRERERREGRLQLKKHRAMAAPTVEGEEQCGRSGNAANLGLLRHRRLDEEVGVRGGARPCSRRKKNGGGRERGWRWKVPILDLVHGGGGWVVGGHLVEGEGREGGVCAAQPAGGVLAGSGPRPVDTARPCHAASPNRGGWWLSSGPGNSNGRRGLSLIWFRIQIDSN